MVSAAGVPDTPAALRSFHAWLHSLQAGAAAPADVLLVAHNGQ
jgi:hypothetical protein